MTNKFTPAAQPAQACSTQVAIIDALLSDLQKRVWEALDRRACPGLFMQVASDVILGFKTDSYGAVLEATGAEGAQQHTEHGTGNESFRQIALRYKREADALWKRVHAAESALAESAAAPAELSKVAAIEQVRPKQQFPDIPAPTAWLDANAEQLARARANPTWYEFRTVYLAAPATGAEGAQQQTDCTVCSGYGHYGDGRDARECHACNGSGKAPTESAAAPADPPVFGYFKEVHPGWPEFNKQNEFSDGSSGEALVKLSDVQALLATRQPSAQPGEEA